MTEQAELNFAVQAEEAAARLPDLRAVLRGRGWLKARELEALGFGDRDLRAIVQHDAAGEIFSYPGSPGYKLFAEVTVEEFARAGALRTQGRAMLRRYVRYLRRWHGRAGL